MKYPSLVKSFSRPGSPADFSTIVIPVFNQQGRISLTLEALGRCVEQATRVIVIDDGSEDQTLPAVISTAQKIVEDISNSINEIDVYRFPVSRFETYCDFVGIRLAQTHYVIEIQADMVLNDYGFDTRLINALRQNSDILLISGRGVERIAPIALRYWNTLGADVANTRSISRYFVGRLLSMSSRMLRKKQASYHRKKSPPEMWRDLVTPILADFKRTGEAGRLGELVEWDFPYSNEDKSNLWLGETVMRGPLAINRDSYMSLGEFRTDLYFLGYDEHDLAIVGASSGLRVAFHPVNFTAPLEEGSTRKPRTLLSEILIFYNLLRVRSRRKESNLRLDESSSVNPLVSEIRKISEI